MSPAAPETLGEAEVVLHLEVEVASERRADFLDFCRRAFPVYEGTGGLAMALYEDRDRPGRFDEVGYYRSLPDYERSERAIREDPAQAALIQEWRALLQGPPKVRVVRRVPTAG